MDRTERFYLIDRMLNEHGVVTRRQFLDKLEVSPATFKRDLAYMRERFNAPIAWDDDRGGYVFERATRAVGPTYALPGLWFNASEIQALLTMDALLEHLQPGLLRGHVAPLRARLEMLLEEGRVEAAEVRKRVRIAPLAARRVDDAVFEAVAAATVKRRRLDIEYRARSTGEATKRSVSPQRLTLYRDNWYLDAWCHMRVGLRKFAVDAIAGAQLSDERAKAVDMRTVERELDAGYGVFGGGTVDWAKLRFTPTRARWVASERWHADQRGTVEPDGHYVLEVPYSDPRELMMDVLKYGADVDVLAPASLRALVAAEVRRMAAQFDADS
ncbi:MAG TPA: WYL domain-containing protein [Casimicrobiaceae bacterium]|nr:WYL domain-containing protein [Casimicrobiaceae bacterium]